MASTTINDFTAELLQKDLITPRSKSALGSEIETFNVMGQIALSLYMNPRTALYFPLLARNSLAAAIGEELTKIDEVRRAVSDLQNMTFAVRDSAVLSNAVSSLAAAVHSGSISSTQVDVVNKAMERFLSGDVRKNVVGAGSLGVMRPGTEAALDLPTLLGELKVIHSIVVDKLYALVVSASNFKAVDFASISGPTVLNRMKDGLESVINEAKADLSGSGSRDMVNRLMAYKTTLASLSAPPNANSALLDSSSGMPKGYSLTATSAPSQTVVTGTVGPYVFPASASLSIQDKAGTLVEANFPVRAYDLGNQAHVVGSFPTTYPVGLQLLVTLRRTSPVGLYWDLGTDGKYTRSFLVVTPPTVADDASFMAAISSSIGPTLVDVVEYPFPGSGKFTIVGKGAAVEQVSIVKTATAYHPGMGFVGLFSSSDVDLARFSIPSGTYGSVTATEVVDSINAMFTGKVVAARSSTGEVVVTGVDNAPGAFLTVSGTSSVLGLDGTALATSTVVNLIGSVNGSPVSVISPLGLMGPSDLVSVPTGASTIASVTQTGINLLDAVPTFSGDIVVTSKLLSVHSALESTLTEHLTTWFESGFEVDLEKVDQRVAAAMGSKSPSAIGNASLILTDLTIALGNVLTVITDASTLLPPGAAAKEVRLATSILNTLAERKMDAAESLLLSGKVQEALLMDTQSLSNGGALSKAITDLAQNDVTFPNLATSDGIQPKAIRRT